MGWNQHPAPRRRHPRQGPQQRPSDHPQGWLHETALRLNQGGPKPQRPHLIHQCPAPLQGSPFSPDNLARNRWTTWPGTAGRLRSEWVDDFVGIGSYPNSAAIRAISTRWNTSSHDSPSRPTSRYGATFRSFLCVSRRPSRHRNCSASAASSGES